MTNVTSTATVIIGLLLLMLSHGLRRRKRRAWQATTVLLAFSAAIHLMHGYRIQGAAAVAVLAGAAVLPGRVLRRGRPTTRWRAAGVFVGLVIADVAIGLTYMLLARHLAEDYSIWQRTVHTVYGLVGVSGPVQFVPDSRADLFNLMTSTLGIFTLVVAAYLFLRPAKLAARATEPDARRIRELLGKYGDRDSLGYFALRRDKNVIWSPSGKSCIGYRVVSGVMLASGDPIGDAEAWPGAIDAFMDEAGAHAWVPAVMGCAGAGRRRSGAAKAGLDALELGDEAIVEVADFSLQGRSHAQRPPDGDAGRAPGIRAGIRRVADLDRGGDATASWRRRRLARHRHRARLLHGAGPGRRRPRTGSASIATAPTDERGATCGRAALRPLGIATGCRWT